jgi:hypothetical protein
MERIVKRTLARAMALTLAAVASAYVFLLVIGVAVAAARSDPGPAQTRTLVKAHLFSPATTIIIALVATVVILGAAWLFTPREPPAWQADVERLRDDSDDERDDEDDEDWRDAA